MHYFTVIDPFVKTLEEDGGKDSLAIWNDELSVTLLAREVIFCSGEFPVVYLCND